MLMSQAGGAVGNRGNVTFRTGWQLRSSLQQAGEGTSSLVQVYFAVSWSFVSKTQQSSGSQGPVFERKLLLSA